MNSVNKVVLGLGLISAVGCQSLQAEKREAAKASLTVKTFTANEAGFLVNSHLIMGNEEAVLVDAQFTRSQAKQVSEMAKASGRKLSTIFITHGHPDHYFGLEVLTQDFPQAKVVAVPEVIEDIKATAQGKLDYWKKLYGNDLADRYIVPAAFSGSSISLEGNEIQLVELGAGESEHATAFYIPSLQTLVAGDMLYNQVHLWVAEDRPEQWLSNLDMAEKLGDIRLVLPGHGENSNAKLIEVNRSYLGTFIAITKKAKTKEAALAELKRTYPKYRLPIIAELSVSARVK